MTPRFSRQLRMPLSAALGTVLAATGLGAAASQAPAAAASASVVLSASTAALASTPQQTVTYEGISAQVPADWPVIDLDKNPGTCVRLDRPVVYLGAASAQQNCPARLIGRADTLWLGPATSADTSKLSSAPKTRAAGQDSRVRRNPVEASQDLDLARSKVLVRTTWGAGPELADAIIATVRSTSAPNTVTRDVPPTVAPSAAPALPKKSDSPAPDTAPQDATPQDTTAQAPSAEPSAPTPTASPAAYEPVGAVVAQPARYVAQPAAVPAVAAAVPPSSERVLGGMGFDTCAAPTTSTMSAWRQSPYAAIGIYIGGALRACGDGNLSASWVNTVSAQGWGLVPIYVGYQAPCNTAGLRAFTATNAASLGASSASDAVAKAKSFGLPAGTTIHYDMEYYPSGNVSCTNAVTTFMNAWTNQVHALGYRSGAYGNTVMMNDMAKAAAAGSFTPPDQIWFALWNYLQNTTSTSFPSTMWTGATRQHQYRGDFTETWGGVSINIDANYIAAPVAGNPVLTSYGANTVGPGSVGFVFTGDMRYWRPAPGIGSKGKSYWTYSSGTGTEYNGASWWLNLPAGSYAVDINVPAGSGATGVGLYTVTDSMGTRKVSLTQSAGGYRTLPGVYVRNSAGAIVVHLGDNGLSASTAKLAVDSVRFRPLTTTDYSYPRDVTNDRRADILALTSAGALRVYPGSGTGGFQAARSGGTINWSAYARVFNAGAWNGDAVSDLMAITKSGDLMLAAGRGDGTFATPVRIGTSWGAFARVLSVGDVTGDNRADLVAITKTGQMYIYRGNGQGNFNGSIVLGGGWTIYNSVMGFGDLNGDKLPDLVARDAAGNLWLYRGNGNGGFAGRVQIGHGFQIFNTLIAPGDFNGDGRADLIGRDAQGNLYLYPGTATAGLGARVKIGIGWGGFSSIPQ